MSNCEACLAGGCLEVNPNCKIHLELVYYARASGSFRAIVLGISLTSTSVSMKSQLGILIAVMFVAWSATSAQTVPQSAAGQTISGIVLDPSGAVKVDYAVAIRSGQM
jgi:hypothetical protein